MHVSHWVVHVCLSSICLYIFYHQFACIYFIINLLIFPVVSLFVLNICMFPVQLLRSRSSPATSKKCRFMLYNYDCTHYTGMHQILYNYAVLTILLLSFPAHIYIRLCRAYTLKKYKLKVGERDHDSFFRVCCCNCVRTNWHSR